MLGTQEQVLLRSSCASPPPFENYDYDRMYLEVYRTLANGTQFYYVTTRAVDETNPNGYLVFDDNATDNVLEANADVDDLRVLKKGFELGTGWSGPPKASCVSSANGRLLLGNLTDYAKTVLSFEGSSTNTFTETNINGAELLFKKDPADSGTTSDMINRAGFRFMKTSAGHIRSLA